MIHGNPVAAPFPAGLPPAGPPVSGTSRPALPVAAAGACGRSVALDRLADLARRLFDAPMAVVSLYDPGCARQVIRGQSGLAGRWAARVSVPRALGFCEQVRRSDLPLVVDDARHDPRGRGLPVLADLGVVAYLGAPLHGDPDGPGATGVFSVIDRQPRSWGAEEAALLATLAATLDEQLHLAARLRAEAADRPRMLARERGRFAGGLGRDLRLQAHAVLGLAAEIEEAPEPPPMREVTAAIRLAGADLLAVAEDLRELARMASGRAAALGDVVVPAAVLAELDPAHRVAARSRGLRLEIEVDGDARLPRRGDPVRLRQVLDHFLGAALARSACGTVALRLDLGRGDRMGVEIEEPAPGPERGPERGPAAAPPPLGDLLAEARVGLMAGRIERVCLPGAGTRLWLDLPLPAIGAVSQTPGAGTALRGRRLLVAEATPTIRRLVEVVLTRAGAEVTAVADTPSAVAACGRTRFDAVLVDLGLAGAEGAAGAGAGLPDRIRTAAAVQGGPPPLVALAAGTAAQRGAALAAGFAAALPRPVDPLTLVAAVLRLLGPAAPDT